MDIASRGKPSEECLSSCRAEQRHKLNRERCLHLAEHDVHRALGTDVFAASIAKRHQIEALKQAFSASHQNGSKGEVQFIDEPGLQVFADRVRATAKPDIFPRRRFPRPFECHMDTLGHEMECCAAFHGQGVSGVVREHKYVVVIGRVGAPPTLPVFVRPRAAHGAEHVPAENPCADIVETSGGKIVVQPGGSGLGAEHLMEGIRLEHPLVERKAANAKWVFEALLHSGAETV
jgi:hypothetical protein